MPLSAPPTSAAVRRPPGDRRPCSGDAGQSGNPGEQGRPTPGEAFVIDCGQCVHRQTPVCDDCVVSFVVGRDPDDALVVDAVEARAVHLLGGAGLLPGLRHALEVS